MNALNLEKQAIAQSNAGFYLGNYCATLLDHKTHLRAWSLIRRASSPPSPASRRRIKNSRVSCLEEGNSPLLMLGEAFPPEAPKARQVLVQGQEGASWEQEGLGMRVEQEFIVFESVQDQRSLLLQKYFGLFRLPEVQP